MPPLDSTVTIQDSQFDCSPRPANWPSDSVLKTWSNADIVDQANKYWFWGYKCESMLLWNKIYFKCHNGDKPSCDTLIKMKEPDVNTTK